MKFQTDEAGRTSGRICNQMHRCYTTVGVSNNNNILGSAFCNDIAPQIDQLGLGRIAVWDFLHFAIIIDVVIHIRVINLRQKNELQRFECFRIEERAAYDHCVSSLSGAMHVRQSRSMI
jgi:hypothetical protein